MTISTTITCDHCCKGINQHYDQFLEVAWAGRVVSTTPARHFCSQRCLALAYAAWMPKPIEPKT